MGRDDHAADRRINSKTISVFAGQIVFGAVTRFRGSCERACSKQQHGLSAFNQSTRFHAVSANYSSGLRCC